MDKTDNNANPNTKQASTTHIIDNCNQLANPLNNNDEQELYGRITKAFDDYDAQIIH